MTTSTSAAPAAVAAATPTDYQEDERIGDLLEQHKDRGPWFSFEFYPPKTPDGVEKLYDRLGKMAPYSEWVDGWIAWRGAAWLDLA
jgi:hypothetical protein